ncbi:MAG: XrtA/PEP-CTERM system TPR-repeat protein PrsT [Alphaproteobacteria bacterium]
MTQSTRQRLRAALLAGVAVAAFAAAGCDEADIVGTETLVERAQESRSKGDLPAAVINLKAALQQEPDSAAAHFLLGQVYLDIADGASAEKEFTRAREAGSNAEAAANAIAQAWILMSEDQKVLDALAVDEGASGIAKAATLGLRGEAFLGLRRADEAEQAFDEALAADPGSIAAMVGRARAALTQGDTAEATARLEPAVKVAPDDRIVILAQGDVAYASGDVSGSLGAYRRLATANPYNLVHHLGLARAQIAGGDISDGIATLDVILKIVPDNAFANLLRSFAALSQGDYEGTLRYTAKVLNVEDGNMGAIFLDGAASFALGNLEQAHRSLTRVNAAFPDFEAVNRLLAATQLRLNQPEQASATLESIINGAPTDAGLLTMLGIAKVQAGDLAAGKSYLARAAEAAPESADARTRLGIVRVATGEEGLGIEDLEAATELDPNDADPDLALIQSYMRAGEFAKAVEAARTLQEKKPDDPSGYIAEGMAQRALGDAAKARAAFETALTKNPDHIGAILALAQLDIDAGYLAAARAKYEGVVQKRPGHLRALIALAAFAQREGREQDYIALLTQAKDANPTAVEPIVLLAQSYLGQGEVDRALVEIAPLTESQPDNPLVLQTQGMAQLQAGEARAAAGTLERLVRVAANSWEAHYLLAQAYAATGENGRVIAELTEAVRINPAARPANISLVRALTLKGDVEPANQLLASLKEGNQSDPDVAALEGWIALRTDRAADAVTAYERAYALAKNHSNAINLAAAYWANEQGDRSAATLQDWVRDDPDDTSAFMELANYQLQLERPREAEATYRLLLERSPNNWLALNNLATIVKDENPEEALTLAEKSYEIMPSAPPVAQTLAELLVVRGQGARAVEMLREHASQFPDNGDLQYIYASALAQTGGANEAKNVLRRILGSDQAFSYRAKAQELLASLP